MNTTLELINQRKSIRAYRDEPIPEEVKHQILKAAMRAPTAGNMMLYTIIEVQDQAVKEQLAVSCDNQPFIARAPLVLVFLADYQRWHDSYCHFGAGELSAAEGKTFRRPAEGDLLLACCDALIAAQNAVIAAESLGLGSCYIGDILEQYEFHQQLFDLPPFAMPVTMLCFGYPTEEQGALPIRPRYDQRFIVHTDFYHRLSPAEMDALYSEANQRFLAGGPRKDGFTNMVQFNYQRKFSADFSIEMTRSVRAMLSRWTGNASE